MLPSNCNDKRKMISHRGVRILEIHGLQVQDRQDDDFPTDRSHVQPKMLPSKKKIFTGWFCSAQTFQIVIQVKSRDKLLTIVWLGNSLCSFLHRSLHHWIVMFIFVSLIVGFTRLYIYYRLYTIDYILHTIYYILYTIYHILYGDGSLDL